MPSDQLTQSQRDALGLTIIPSAASPLAETVAGGASELLVLANAGTLLALGDGFGLHAETLQRLLLGADLAVILFPYMVLVCLAAAFSAACQVLGRFTEVGMIDDALSGFAPPAYGPVPPVSPLAVAANLDTARGVVLLLRAMHT